MAIQFNKLLSKLWRLIDFQRTNLKQLVAAGRTIGIEEVVQAKNLKIFAANFRVGREFWATPPGSTFADLEIEFEMHTICGGRLVLDEEGYPATDRQLRKYGIPWTQFVFRY